jgi:hypothetical protein
MIRATIARLRDGPEWRLEVVDEAGTIRHLFRLTAETPRSAGRLRPASIEHLAGGEPEGATFMSVA